MIPISVIGKRAFIFNLKDVEVARDFGILGTLSGTLSLAPQQNVLLGLPLQLMAEEVVWLVKSKLGYIVTTQELLQSPLKVNEHSPDFSYNEVESKLPVFYKVEDADNNAHHFQDLSDAFKDESTQLKLLEQFLKDSQPLYDHLRDQGFMLCPGMRFGGTFVAYPGDPLRYHSHLIVNSRDYYNDDIGLKNIINGGRLATGVKKLWLVGGQSRNSEWGDAKEEKVSCFSVEWAGFG